MRMAEWGVARLLEQPPRFEGSRQALREHASHARMTPWLPKGSGHRAARVGMAWYAAHGFAKLARIEQRTTHASHSSERVTQLAVARRAEEAAAALARTRTRRLLCGHRSWRLTEKGDQPSEIVQE